MTGFFSPQEMQEFVTKYKAYFTPTNRNNPTGKSYQDLTAADLKKVSTADIGFVRSMLEDEQYHYLDSILPKSMNRQEFFNAILRESAERGEITRNFIDPFKNIPGYPDKQLTVTRKPFGVSDSVDKTVTASASTIAVRDAVVTMLTRSVNSFGLSSDVAAGLGIQDNNFGAPLRTDAAAYRFGYAAAGMPEFKDKNSALYINLAIVPANAEDIKKKIQEMTNGKTQEQIEAARTTIQKTINDMSAASIQGEYCSKMGQLVESGNALTMMEAVKWGFAQGRVNSGDNSGYTPAPGKIGIKAQCGR